MFKKINVNNIKKSYYTFLNIKQFLFVILIICIMYSALLKYHRYRRNFLSSYEWYFSKFLVYRTISCYWEVFYTDRRWICCIFKYALLNILIAQGRWINQIMVVSRDSAESTPYGDLRVRFFDRRILYHMYVWNEKASLEEKWYFICCWSSKLLIEPSV